MQEISRIGLDTSKYMFQVYGVNATEQPVLCRTLRRGQVERFFCLATSDGGGGGSVRSGTSLGAVVAEPGA